MTPIEVAIIEDDPLVSSSLREYIKQDPSMECVFAVSSVEEALPSIALLSTLQSYIIILDIGLPGMSGLDGIVAIQKVLPKAEIIMLTSYDDSDKIFTALRNGACSYISKNTSLTDIMRTIKTVSRGGSYMSPSIARKIARFFKPKKKTYDIEQLTDRQMELVGYLSTGLSYKLIAGQMNISIDTVRSHIKKIYKILQVNSKIEVLKIYNQRRSS